MTRRNEQIEPFTPYVIGPKPWGEEKVIAETDKYLVKLLTMRAGSRGGLQYHQAKDESFYLLSGTATVVHDNGRGQLTRTVMTPGQCFHIRPFTVHQVIAQTDCLFIEGSTPVFEDRVNVSERYGVGEDGQAR